MITRRLRWSRLRVVLVSRAVDGAFRGAQLAFVVAHAVRQCRRWTDGWRRAGGRRYGLGAAVRHTRESITASVADEEWQRARDVPLRGDPPPARGRHPTRSCWLQGVGQGRSPRTAANVHVHGTLHALTT